MTNHTAGLSLKKGSPAVLAVLPLTLLVIAGVFAEPQAPRGIQLVEAAPASGRPSFEVASIKVNRSLERATSNFPLGPGPAMMPVGGLFTVTNTRLSDIISFAYKLSGNDRYLAQVLPGLPGWVTSERFDVQARAIGTPTKDDFRVMVQSLLADRFQMSMHAETRTLPVYAFVLARPGRTGPQLTLHTDDSTCLAALPFRPDMGN